MISNLHTVRSDSAMKGAFVSTRLSLYTFLGMLHLLNRMKYLERIWLGGVRK